MTRAKISARHGPSIFGRKLFAHVLLYVCKSDLKPKMVKKLTFMDNIPLESTGFYRPRNCAILPKNFFQDSPLVPYAFYRFIFFIMSILKSDSNKLFSGQPYRINHGECCDSTTGAVGKLEEAAQCDA